MIFEKGLPEFLRLEKDLINFLARYRIKLLELLFSDLDKRLFINEFQPIFF